MVKVSRLTIIKIIFEEKIAFFIPASCYIWQHFWYGIFLSLDDNHLFLIQQIQAQKYMTKLVCCFSLQNLKFVGTISMPFYWHLKKQWKFGTSLTSKTSKHLNIEVYNRNSRKRCNVCSKSTIKTAKQNCFSGDFIVNFEHISHLFIRFPLLTLNKCLLGRLYVQTKTENGTSIIYNNYLVLILWILSATSINQVGINEKIETKDNIK